MVVKLQHMQFHLGQRILSLFAGILDSGVGRLPRIKSVAHSLMRVARSVDSGGCHQATNTAMWCHRNTRPDHRCLVFHVRAMQACQLLRQNCITLANARWGFFRSNGKGEARLAPLWALGLGFAGIFRVRVLPLAANHFPTGVLVAASFA
jgi:hypothetical protein